MFRWMPSKYAMQEDIDPHWIYRSTKKKKPDKGIDALESIKWTRKPKSRKVFAGCAELNERKTRCSTTSCDRVSSRRY